MNQKELKELIEFLIEKDIAEFELERGDVKSSHQACRGTGCARCALRHSLDTSPNSTNDRRGACSCASRSPAAKEAPPVVEEVLHIVHSPIVGTFYESPSPGSPPFVKAGDTVELGQVICIVEAMKLMNEIESDVAGEIVKRLVANNQPIEYGQELFTIRPRK